MADFLDQMAAGSRRRVREAMAATTQAELRSRCGGLAPPLPPVLRGGFDLIAELKLRSPALGALGAASDDVAARVTQYATAGAAAVSVLTEPDRFEGSLQHLERAAAALAPLGVPAMRKDFLVDPFQLHEARAAGAGGALLIVRMLSRGALAEMLDCAAELGLFVLLEAFDEEDIAVAVEVLGSVRPGDSRRALSPQGIAPVERSRSPGGIPGGALAPRRMIGVNSRDLQSLEVVPERLARLAPLLPQSCPRVAESGLETPADAAAMVRAGYDMALVGGALMKAADPGALVRAMLDAGRAAAA